MTVEQAEHIIVLLSFLVGLGVVGLIAAVFAFGVWVVAHA